MSTLDPWLLMATALASSSAPPEPVRLGPDPINLEVMK